MSYTTAFLTRTDFRGEKVTFNAIIIYIYICVCKDAGKSFFEEFREMLVDSCCVRWQQQRSVDFQTTCPRFPLLHMPSRAVYDDDSNSRMTSILIHDTHTCKLQALHRSPQTSYYIRADRIMCIIYNYIGKNLNHFI